MKKIILIALAIFMATLVACGSDSSPTGSSNSLNGGTGGTVEAFFPKNYDASNVLAWYATSLTTVPQGDRTVLYLDAVYLFDDGSFLVTQSRKIIETDQIVFSNYIVAEGDWHGTENDFRNGSFYIETEGMSMLVEIKNGSFTVEDGNEIIAFNIMGTSVPAGSEIIKNKVTETTSPEEDDDDGEPGVAEESLDDYYGNKDVDDNEAIGDISCQMVVYDNYIAVSMSYAGMSEVIMYSLTDDGYMISYSDTELEPTHIPTPVTIDELESIADQTCKAFKSDI